MVVTYLEKIRDGFMNEKINTNRKVEELQIIYKENIAFINLLEQNNDEHFEAFSPRTVNSFHKRKIDELKEEQKKIELQITSLKSSIIDIDREIEEVKEIIRVAKEKGL